MALLLAVCRLGKNHLFGRGLFYRRRINNINISRYSEQFEKSS